MRGQNRKGLIRALAAIFAVALCPAGAQEGADLRGLRGDAPLAESARATPAAPVADREGRRVRNYPEQPPTIPHAVDNYEVSLRANRCLSCHSRRVAAEKGAPMISVTHFMGADLQMLADVSPRRYFCVQCHVTQTTERALVDNDFVDSAALSAP